MAQCTTFAVIDMSVIVYILSLTYQPQRMLRSHIPTRNRSGGLQSIDIAASTRPRSNEPTTFDLAMSFQIKNAFGPVAHPPPSSTSSHQLLQPPPASCSTGPLATSISFIILYSSAPSIYDFSRDVYDPQRSPRVTYHTDHLPVCSQRPVTIGTQLFNPNLDSDFCPSLLLSPDLLSSWPAHVPTLSYLITLEPVAGYDTPGTPPVCSVMSRSLHSPILQRSREVLCEDMSKCGPVISREVAAEYGSKEILDGRYK